MRLVQFFSENGDEGVAVVRSSTSLNVVSGATCIRDLAREAYDSDCSLEELVRGRYGREEQGGIDYERIVVEKRLRPPLDHPDPAHCHVTGTGLTHLGSAAARDRMHSGSSDEQPVAMTDSMKLFQWGVEGGKLADGRVSVQPEWFYKGSGHCIVAPELALNSPAFALDGGEEAEIVGLYVVADDGRVLRVGFALGNEFSDHVVERQNYLYLAHSKLRTCAFGPELLLGELPGDIRGQVRVVRDGREVWCEQFLTGEDNMSYTIAQLEHHHFKYADFRIPGQVHCHFFGTATLSYSSGFRSEPGDVFEISAPPFGRALRNPLGSQQGGDQPVRVHPL